MTLIDASLGRGAVIASISAISAGRGRGSSRCTPTTAHVPEPYPEFSLTGVGVWALEDWTGGQRADLDRCPAATSTAAAARRRGAQPGRADRDAEGQRGLLPPRGLALAGRPHRARRRVTIHSHFNRGILRSLEPKKVDVQMLHRNPPRLGEMLGEDDWFDKMSAHGRDYGRFAYMAGCRSSTTPRRPRFWGGPRRPEGRTGSLVS
jgi:hypothetical protein